MWFRRGKHPTRRFRRPRRNQRWWRSGGQARGVDIGVNENINPAYRMLPHFVLLRLFESQRYICIRIVDRIEYNLINIAHATTDWPVDLGRNLTQELHAFAAGIDVDTHLRAGFRWRMANVVHFAGGPDLHRCHAIHLRHQDVVKRLIRASIGRMRQQQARDQRAQEKISGMQGHQNAVVLWQLSHSAVVGIWSASLPVASTPLWHPEQLPIAWV